MRSPGALVVVVAVVAGACGYARPDDVPNAPNDAAPADSPGLRCFGAGIGRVCLERPPGPPVNIVADFDVDTDGPFCSEIIAIGEIETCVVAATSVAVNTGVTVRATGSRPLVVIASENLVVAGSLSVGSSQSPQVLGAGASSAAASTTLCPSGSAGTSTTQGAGGGAGGSLFGSGGNGGRGDTGAPGGVAAANMPPTQIRAGCPGSRGGAALTAGGDGGGGGGALYLIAGNEIQIAGSVSAFGAGGRPGAGRSGGGGGGSGGMIGLNASVVKVSGTIAANGGGGGEGAGSTPGFPGQDGTISANPAMGGAGSSGGGNGGNGSAGAIVAGSDGLPGGAGGGGGDGGGGGGGAAGYIFMMTGSLEQIGSTISPAPDVL